MTSTSRVQLPKHRASSCLPLTHNPNSPTNHNLTTMPLRRNPPNLLLHLRPFSTHPYALKPQPQPRYTRLPPPYPYGPSTHYKQSNSGLYGGSSIQFGNQISSKNEIKTRRTWHPNMRRKRLWSDALDKFVQVKVQARVLRTIDKCGGLDEYLLGDKPGRIKELGETGWRLRWLVMRTDKVRRRFGRERVALGLPAEEKTKKKRRAKKTQTTMMDESTTEAETLGEEVERASEEVVERIQGAEADGKPFSRAEPELEPDPEPEPEPVSEAKEEEEQEPEHAELVKPTPTPTPTPTPEPTPEAAEEERKIGMDMEKEKEKEKYAEGDGMMGRIKGLLGMRR